MTDYIILILAVFCFVGQFAFTKVYEKSVRQTLVTSLVMLVATSFIGMAIYLFVGGFKVQITAFSLAWAVAMGVIMIPYYMIGIKVLSLGSLAVYSMFMMLGGMLVPFFYGILFLNEDASPTKIVGCVLLTAFIIMQAISQQNAETATGAGDSQKKQQGKWLFTILCLAIFFINGMTTVIAKTHQIGPNPVDEISFTVISCGVTTVVSAIMLVVALVFGKKETRSSAKSSLTRTALLAMAAIGAAAYTGNFLLLKAAVTVPASVQFPLVSGGAIVISALVSAFIFKEKLSKMEWISIVGAFFATFLFAF